MTIHDTLEEIRVFSHLSESCHYITVDSKKYACLGGMILPYNVAVTVMLWVMTGNRSYEHLLSQHGQLDKLADLNPHDDNMKQSPSKVCWYISNKAHNIMHSWSESDFEHVLLSTEV